MKLRNNAIKHELIELLIKRNPNYISENMIQLHLGARNIGQEELRIKLSEALDSLEKEGKVEKFLDPREEVGEPLSYYRIINPKTYPIDETLTIGVIELPRILSCSNPKVLPSEFDEAIIQLGKYTNQLEHRFHEIVKEEQKDYWAKIVGVFTIFLGVLTVVIAIIPKAVSQIKPTVESDLYGMIKLSLASLIPVIVVFVVAAFVIVKIIRK